VKIFLISFNTVPQNVLRLDTSIAARNGGCFPASATVELESGETCSMEDLSVGQRVLTVYHDGSLHYDDVITFIHRQPQLVTSFVVIATADGHRLVATGDHLVFTSSAGGGGDHSAVSFSDLAPPTAVFMSQLTNHSDAVYVASPGTKEHLLVSMVTSVNKVVARGVYAPLTASGTIVVDGVVASCYALVSSHRLAHAVMAPVRTFSPWWNSYNISSLDGVHWYAEFMRRLAETLFLADSLLWNFAS